MYKRHPDKFLKTYGCAMCTKDIPEVTEKMNEITRSLTKFKGMMAK